MHEIEGFILAGGASNRMKRDKAELLLGGKTFIEHAAFSLQTIAPQNIYTVGNGKKESFGLPVLSDAIDKNTRGAIIGLYTTLVHTKAEWTAVLACDFPFMTGELFEKLISLTTEDFDAVVPGAARWQSAAALRFIPPRIVSAGNRRNAR